MYRDIKERGRNLNNVIGRYHKFVKPAFDEYIRPTRKLADVIIPRGAENTVAIDLVSQHLKYQLTKIFNEKQLAAEDTNNSNGNKKSSTQKDIIISQHELIDPKYQFFDEKVIVTEDAVNIEVLQHIFTDFINGRNFTYYKIFLEQMTNTLLSLYLGSKISNPNPDDVVITELDDNKAKGNKKKKIIYFQTSMLNEKDFDKLEYLYKSFII